jgi:hypothetical protein
MALAAGATVVVAAKLKYLQNQSATPNSLLLLDTIIDIAL